jgi:cell division septation protein DedD
VSEPPALARANYTIAAGAFLLRSNLAGAERKVTESGFEPQVVQKMQWMDMTRLRVGVFSPEEGKKKMEELEELTTNAFYLPADGKVAVYAGSFQNLDKARSFADRLYKQGLRVEEESAHVEVPLYLLSFGGFDDLESAREAAERVRTAGLDAMVVKNP